MTAIAVTFRERAGLPGRLVSLSLAALAVLLLWLGLDVVRDPSGPGRLFAAVYDLTGQHAAADAIRERGLDDLQAKLTVAVVALVVGIGGVWALYVGLNGALDLLRPRHADRLRPYVFVGPAILMVTIFLVVPAILTLWSSLFENGGFAKNYGALLDDPAIGLAIRNNALWLVVGTAGSVGIGLLVAALVDRIKREALAKTFVFLPLAISMAGAAVIWRFVYAWQPEGEAQIGVLNAVWTGLGNEPQPWLQQAPLNTFLLIVIMIWLQTGFAMVVLSAALKSVPNEVIEAARLDGSGEANLFFRIVLPMIRGTVLAVTTTIAIAILKVFDIVYVTTGGSFDTEVLASRMFTEMFSVRNFGRASAIAVVLFVAIFPIIVANLRNLRRQGIDA